MNTARQQPRQRKGETTITDVSEAGLSILAQGSLVAFAGKGLLFPLISHGMTYLNEWNKPRKTSFERYGNPGINRINDCVKCGNHIYHVFEADRVGGNAGDRIGKNFKLFLH